MKSMCFNSFVRFLLAATVLSAFSSCIKDPIFDNPFTEVVDSTDTGGENPTDTTDNGGWAPIDSTELGNENLIDTTDNGSSVNPIDTTNNGNWTPIDTTNNGGTDNPIDTTSNPIDTIGNGG